MIGYDDAESVAKKTEWAMKKGLRGVFFWQVAARSPARWHQSAPGSVPPEMG